MSNDIRKGDLVKATLKDRPEEYAVFRVSASGLHGVWSKRNVFERRNHDFEVLERPIEKELLDGAVAAGGKPYGFKPGNEGATFRGSVQAVIEFVRAYDKEHAR